MGVAEWGMLVTGAIGLAYFIGLHRGHALACTRIAYLAERERLTIGQAVKGLEALDRSIFNRKDFDADEIAFVQAVKDLPPRERN